MRNALWIVVVLGMSACNQAVSPLESEGAQVVGTLQLPMSLTALGSDVIGGSSGGLSVQRAETLIVDNTNAESNRRFLMTTFRVYNGGDKKYSNLSLRAYAKAGVSLGGTAFSGIVGELGSNVIENRVAWSMQPVQAVLRGSSPPQVNNARADFQAFTPAETQALEKDARSSGVLRSSDTLLDYGFQINSNGKKSDELKPGETGLVTVAIRMPKTVADGNAPVSFDFNFVITASNPKRATQGINETPDQAAARAKAADQKTLVLLGSGTGGAAGFKDKDILRIANPKLSTYPTYLLDVDSGIGVTCPTGPAGAPRIIPQGLSVKSPMVSFISDDGFKEDYTVLLPIFRSRGVVAASAIPSQFVIFRYWTDLGPDSLRHMYDDQIRELQSAGWEIMDHSRTHADLATVSPAKLEEELGTSKRELEAMGLRVRNVVYPFGSTDPVSRTITCQHYRAGFLAAADANVGEIAPYRIQRVPLGAFFFNDPRYGNLAYYKSKVDEAIKNNGWLVFMLHPWSTDFDATQREALGSVIDYVKSKGVPILTPNQALDRLGF